MNVREKAVGIYRALPVAHRVMVGASIIVVAMGAYLFMGWVNRPSYTVVYQASDATELTEVVEQLNAAGVANTVVGNTVSVAAGDVTEARMALSDTSGVGGGSDCEGYELLDSGGFSVSNAVQDVNIQRAKECELQRDLLELDFVRSATVNLALPDEALFAEDQQPPSAAVMITPTRPLSQDEVQTIAAVVAGSVEGLDPSDVIVTDGSTVRSGAGSTTDGQDNLDFTRALERDGERKVEDMLEPLLGSGMVSVSIGAELNFDRSTITERTVDPATAVALAQSTSSETFTGAGAPPGGVVGVDGGPVVTDTSDGTTNYERVSEVSQFAVSEVYREAEEAAGRIERMSVAVLMDDGTASGLPDPPTAEQITALVSAALGLDPARGDTISVQAIAFPQEGLAEATPPESIGGGAASPVTDMVPKVIGGLVLVLVTVALLLMTRKPKAPKRDAAYDGPAELYAGAGTGSAYDAIMPALEARSRALPAGEPGMDNVRDDLIDLVDRQPEEIAMLLRGWLSDRRTEPV